MAEDIDAATGRPFGDHGTGEQAIEWILDHSGMAWEADTFLRAWREGSAADEWPDYYEWLTSKP